MGGGNRQLLSQEPNGEPWPESKLDEEYINLNTNVVTSIERFHQARLFKQSTE